MINSVVDLFEKIATHVHHSVVLNDMLKDQAPEVRQALYHNDGYALKSLFCNPAELADKTTVFQS